jgi:TonB family protein
MRVHLVIVFSLICGPAIADETVETGVSTAVSTDIGPFSIGRAHTCASYYPPTALKVRAQGTDLMEFTVTASGSVKDVKVAKSSGNKELDDAAVTCVSHWLYKPATKDSTPTEVLWKANVVWNIALPPAVQTALGCLYHRESTSTPQSLGQTAVSFRVSQEGAVSNVRITQSSGSTIWDDIGISCTQARHYNVSIFTVPDEGLSAHLEMDWVGAIASLAQPTTPAQK